MSAKTPSEGAMALALTLRGSRLILTCEEVAAAVDSMVAEAIAEKDARIAELEGALGAIAAGACDDPEGCLEWVNSDRPKEDYARWCPYCYASVSLKQGGRGDG